MRDNEGVRLRPANDTFRHWRLCGCVGALALALIAWGGIAAGVAYVGAALQ